MRDNVSIERPFLIKMKGVRVPGVGGGAMSSPGHEIQSFFTSYLVLHFPEVWKCGKVRQSKDIVALSRSHEPFVILYLVPHFSEVWKCGKV